MEILSAMLDSLESFIHENDLYGKSDRIMVTVSGGIDSIVLLDLLLKLGYSCSVAHCNFKLRNNESDEDEQFVRELAEKKGIPVYCKSFDTSEYSENNKISTQMAARELRYDWFEELRQEKGYDWIATAHNKNDVIETFLLNLTRGTGIKGLTGIRSKSGRITRPLLFATREEIRNYALSKNLDWREDSSNASSKYNRNRIRHQIIPVFEEINPRFVFTLEDNIRKLKEFEEIYLTAIREKQNKLVVREHNHSYILVNELVKLHPIDSWAFELLRDFNFTQAVVSDIIRSLDGTPGRQFFSSTHRLVKDRGRLLIHPIRDEISRRYYIENTYREISEPIRLEMDIIPNSDEFRIPASPLVACLDFDFLEFPLLIRKWEAGDYFRPLGMNNIKKLSDFFIDIKLSIPEKENTWILQSGCEIAWIIGLRIADHFKIRPDSKRIFKISKL